VFEVNKVMKINLVLLGERKVVNEINCIKKYSY